MKFIEWNDNLSVKIESIDDEHKIWFYYHFCG